MENFNTQLTKNFNISEFDCKDTTAVPWNLVDNVTLLAENLQVIRDTIQERLTVTSGYRNPTYNKSIGGAPESYHMKAMAADIVCKGLSPDKLHDVIVKLIKAKKIIDGGLELYPGFVHYDVGPHRRW